MVYEIVWTEQAITSLEKVINYLIENWSLKIAKEFNGIVNQHLKLISTAPFLGVVSVKEPSIRRILITKHNALYYKVEKNTIILLDIFDTRKKPNSNPFET